MDGGAWAFIFAILVMAVLVFVAILLTGKRAHHFNVEQYQARMLAIENKLRKDNPATYAISIINADKLLDKALMEMGVPGKTMGERLKKIPNKFKDINGVWRAHKLRNALAHEPDFEVSYRQASNALVVYKQALKDLGAI